MRELSVSSMEVSRDSKMAGHFRFSFPDDPLMSVIDGLSFAAITPG